MNQTVAAAIESGTLVENDGRLETRNHATSWILEVHPPPEEEDEQDGP